MLLDKYKEKTAKLNSLFFYLLKFHPCTKKKKYTQLSKFSFLECSFAYLCSTSPPEQRMLFVNICLKTKASRIAPVTKLTASKIEINSLPSATMAAVYSEQVESHSSKS